MKFPRLITIAALVVGLAAIKPASAAPPLAMGFYPSYRESLPPTSIRFDRYTHIIHSFASADAAGKMTVSGNLPSKALTTAAHAKGVKALVALGGGANGKNFGIMVRDPALRAAFIADVVKLTVDNAYDGIVVDWEYPLVDDKAANVEFIAQLRAALSAAKPGSLLGMAVNSKPNNSKGQDGPKLKDNLDFVFVMTYDFHGPWSHAGHNSSLYEVPGDTSDGKVLSYNAALTYWRDIQGFAPRQIILGMAAYGRGFRVAEWGEKPTAPGTHPTFSYKDTRALIGNGWTRQWDTEAHAPWLLSDDKTERLSYDDEQSIAEKAAWIKAQGLPGYFFWEIWQDYTDGDNQLAAAAQKAWNAEPVK